MNGKIIFFGLFIFFLLVTSIILLILFFPNNPVPTPDPSPNPPVSCTTWKSLTCDPINKCLLKVCETGATICVYDPTCSGMPIQCNTWTDLTCDYNTNTMIQVCETGNQRSTNVVCGTAPILFNSLMNLKTPDGFCMDISGNNINSQTYVGVWDCNGTDGQNFIYNGDRTLSVFNIQTNTKYCLNVVGSKGVSQVTPGTGVWLYDCADSTNLGQFWTYNYASQSFSPDNAPNLVLTQHGKWAGQNNLTLEVPNNNGSQKFVASYTQKSCDVNNDAGWIDAGGCDVNKKCMTQKCYSNNFQTRCTVPCQNCNSSSQYDGCDFTNCNGSYRNLDACKNLTYAGTHPADTNACSCVYNNKTMYYSVLKNGSMFMTVDTVNKKLKMTTDFNTYCYIDQTSGLIYFIDNATSNYFILDKNLNLIASGTDDENKKNGYMWVYNRATGIIVDNSILPNFMWSTDINNNIYLRPYMYGQDNIFLDSKTVFQFMDYSPGQK